MTPRPMTRAELDRALDWAAEEGWNPGRDDAAQFLSADPHGFLVLDDPSGAPAASISIVRVGEARFFLGLFICRPDLRGQGYAGPLWRAAMDRAGDAAVGLDGVVAEQERYAMRGFVATHRTVRFAGRAASAPAGTSEPVAAADLEAIAALDHEATGFTRPDFVRGWMTPCPGRHVRVVRRAGRPVAAGAMRRCREGWKIGPLLAREAGAAGTVLGDLAALARDAPIMLDTPEDVRGAAGLARGLGLAPVFEVARMWKGPPPRRGRDMEYGVATLELG